MRWLETKKRPSFNILYLWQKSKIQQYMNDEWYILFVHLYIHETSLQIWKSISSVPVRSEIFGQIQETMYGNHYGKVLLLRENNYYEVLKHPMRSKKHFFNTMTQRMNFDVCTQLLCCNQIEDWEITAQMKEKKIKE